MKKIWKSYGVFTPTAYKIFGLAVIPCIILGLIELFVYANLFSTGISVILFFVYVVWYEVLVDYWFFAFGTERKLALFARTVDCRICYLSHTCYYPALELWCNDAVSNRWCVRHHLCDIVWQLQLSDGLRRKAGFDFENYGRNICNCERDYQCVYSKTYCEMFERKLL